MTMASTYSEWGPFIGMIVGTAIGLGVYLFSNRAVRRRKERDG